MSAPSSLPRQMPVNETTAPTSLRPAVNEGISRETSKSDSWTRMVTLAVMTSAGLSAGHRGGEGDLGGAGNPGILFDVGMVDGGANHARCLEGVGLGLAA